MPTRPPSWVSVFWYGQQFQNVGQRAKRILREGHIQFRQGFDKIAQSFYILVKRADFERAADLLNRELGA